MQDTKKMKCYKQFVQVSGLCGPQFLSYFSKHFMHLRRALYGRHIDVLFWCTNTAARNPQKHLEFTFSIKALSFHWESSICAHKHILEMVILLKIKRSSLFSSRQHSYFSVTHCENSEVEIVVFWK